MLSKKERLIWVVSLLLLYWTLAASSALFKSNTYDEIVHLTSGFLYWQNDNLVHITGNGIVAQRWATWPLVFQDIQAPTKEILPWWTLVWQKGKDLFYHTDNNLSLMLWTSRSMIALFGVLLGWVIYHASSTVFGFRGGLISLILFAFSPSLLAHGRLVTGDMVATLFFTATIWSLWLLLQRCTPLRLLASVVAMALLFLSKTSAVIIVPVGLILLAIRVAVGGGWPIEWRKRSYSIQARGKQLLFAGLLIVVHVVVAGLAIHWGYAMDAQQLEMTEAKQYMFDQKYYGLMGTFARFLIDYGLLPQAYVFTMIRTIDWIGIRISFLHGEYTILGHWYFFPYAFLIKTPLTCLLLFPLLGGALVKKYWQEHTATFVKKYLYQLAPFIVFLVVYSFFALRANLNIGERHFIPVYPSLFIILGANAFWLQEHSKRMKLVVSTLLLLYVANAFWMWPHYLAHFNSLIGGPQQGHKHLVDSSLDWGQDLPGLQDWLAKNRENERVYLAYFGTAEPDHYGIDAVRIARGLSRTSASFPQWRPGIYCISATLLQSVYIAYQGPWTVSYEEQYQKRHSSADIDAWERHQLEFSRLCAFLRQKSPDDHVGHSILIFRLSQQELDQALQGPPVELKEDGQIKGEDQIERPVMFKFKKKKGKQE